MKKNILAILVLLLGACGNKTSMKDKASRNILIPNREGLAVYKTVAYLSDISDQSELFYLTSLEDAHTDFRSLYYHPSSKIFLQGKMYATQKSASPYKVRTSRPERAYISLQPVTISNYTYVGIIDTLTRLYTNQKGAFLQKFEIFKLHSMRTYQGMYEPEYATIYPMLDEANPEVYDLIDNNSIYRLNQDFNTLVYYAGLDSVKLAAYTKPDLPHNEEDEIYSWPIPEELTNNKPELANLIQKMDRKIPPYTNISLNRDIPSDIPYTLKILLSASPSIYDDKEFASYTNALDQALSYYAERYELDPYSFIQTDTYKLFPIIFRYLTNYDAREIYTLSLTNSDYWENYALEMPDFQWLLKAGVPMPNDLMVPSYNYKKSRTDIVPIIHYFARRGYITPIYLILEHNPNYNISIRDNEGLSISQAAVSRGNLLLLKNLMKDLPSINPHEVTASNETWVDLAYKLPLYNVHFPEDNVDTEHEETRSYILTNLAPKYKITNNIPLTTNFIYNAKKPRSMASLQAQYKQKNPKFQFVLPHEIRQEHHFLFEKDVPTNLDLEQFIILDDDSYSFYPKYVHETYARLVQFLVDGAGVEYQTIDSNGNNVLGYVVQTDRKDLFDFFIAKGVSPRQINNKGENLLHIACHSSSTDGWRVAFGDSHPTVYLDDLVKLGLDLNLLDKDGNTPYSRYMSSGCYITAEGELSQKFRRLGADPSKGKYADPESFFCP
ncbi:MAG: hypothetical protein ACRCY4_01270 [Brevinema sp.]